MGTSSILAVVAAFALVLMVGVVRGDLGGNSEDILMLPEQSVKMEFGCKSCNGGDALYTLIPLRRFCFNCPVGRRGKDCGDCEILYGPPGNCTELLVDPNALETLLREFPSVQQQVSDNTKSIQVNAQNIQANADGIKKNAAAIQANAQSIKESFSTIVDTLDALEGRLVQDEANITAALKTANDALKMANTAVAATDVVVKSYRFGYSNNRSYKSPIPGKPVFCALGGSNVAHYDRHNQGGCSVTQSAGSWSAYNYCGDNRANADCTITCIYKAGTV